MKMCIWTTLPLLRCEHPLSHQDKRTFFVLLSEYWPQRLISAFSEINIFMIFLFVSSIISIMPCDKSHDTKWTPFSISYSHWNFQSHQQRLGDPVHSYSFKSMWITRLNITKKSSFILQSHRVKKNSSCLYFHCFYNWKTLDGIN